MTITVSMGGTNSAIVVQKVPLVVSGAKGSKGDRGDDGTSLAIKQPAKVATSENIDLSGLFEIDGVTLEAGDRVLVKDQTEQSENGVWVAATSGWLRASDFDSADEVVKGTQVLVTDGPVGGRKYYAVATDDPVIGTSDITFTSASIYDYSVSPGSFGITGTGDETTKLQEMVDYAGANGLRIEWPDGGRFEFSELDIDTPQNWYCPGKCELYSNKTSPAVSGDDYAIRIQGEEIGEVAVAADFGSGASVIELSDASDVQIGDLLHISSTRLIPTDNRGAWREGCTRKVLSKSGNFVTLDFPVCYSAKASDDVTGEVTAISGDRYTMTVDTMRPGSLRDRTCLLTITSGSATGESRYIVRTDGSDVTHSGGISGEWDRDPWPAGVQVGDTYSWKWETVARILRPVTASIEGIKLCRDQVLDATAGDSGFQGLMLAFTDAPKVRRCEFANFSRVNLIIDFSTEWLVEDCDMEGANRAYSTSAGTGYGVSIVTSTRGVARNVRVRGSRRGLDVTGAGGYSDHNRVQIMVTGGGKTYEGLDFWPAGDQRQSVCGSHGAGLFNDYSGSVGVNCYGGLNIRGRGETANNCRFYGSMSRMYNISFTSGFTADGGLYDDMVSEDFAGPDDRWTLDAAEPTKRLEMVVDMDLERSFADKVRTTILNQRIKSVSACGVRATGESAIIQGLTCMNWDMSVSAEDSGETEFRFLQCPSSTKLADCVFESIQGFQQVGGAHADFNPLFGIPEDYDISSGAFIRINGEYWARIVDGDVVQFPCALRVAYVDMVNARTGDRPRCIGLIVENDTAGARDGSSTKIDVLASEPTAPADVTAGNFGLHLGNANNTLTVFNNTGLDQTFRLSVR